jgi:hypothetical protein
VGAQPRSTVLVGLDQAVRTALFLCLEPVTLPDEHPDGDTRHRVEGRVDHHENQESDTTKDAVVAHQAQVVDQLPPIPGEPRVAYAPVAQTPPDWWAEALIPLDDPQPSA